MIPTIEQADAYHLPRATTDWLAADDAAKTAALHRAADYISFTYSVSDPADDLVTTATIVLAPFALAGALIQVTTAAIVREKVDGVAEIQYSDKDIGDRFPFVSAILSPIVTGSSSASFQSIKVTL